MNKYILDAIEEVMFSAALEAYQKHDEIVKLDNVEDKLDAVRNIVKSYLEETKWE